jgi:hypothetical protein
LRWGGLALWLVAGLALAQIPDGPNGEVLAIARGADGTVYLGGAFTAVGPQTGGGAALGQAGGGAVDRAFPPVVGSIFAVAADGAGGWYIGGDFTAVGGQPRNNLARIDAGGAVTAWNPDAIGRVLALAVDGGIVYAGGEFTHIGGVIRNFLAALDAATGAPTAWNPNPNSSVKALAVAGGTVYAGGFFTAIGGQPRNRLAALDALTGLATAWNPDASYWVLALAVSGGTVYASGNFFAIGGQPRNYLAALDAATGAATAWNPNPDNTVFALAVSGGTVYASGNFFAIGGQPRNYLAALDAATGAPTAWNPNADSFVRALAVSGGIVYAGGEFTTVGGQTRHRLAALDAAGAATAWDPNANGSVNALAVSGGTVYAGGNFTTMGGQPRNYLAALDAATGAATDWNPNANAPVGALAVSGGTVYAGGRFTTVGGQPRNRLAALDAATGVATAWNPDASGFVNALAVSGGVVYAGGAFTALAGQRFAGAPRSFAALLPSAGICGDGFRPQAGPGAPWQTLALPCQPAPPATVQSTLGNAPAANFNAATLNSLWALFTRDAAADAYVRAGLGDPVGPGAGYWLRSFETPVNGLLAFAGSASPVANVTGCASTAGCYVIPLVAAADRYQLIGNPHAYDSDWARVRLLVDNLTAFSPHEAAQPANDFMSNTFWLWNDTLSGYDSCNDVTPGMTCPQPLYKAFWIKTLPGAVGRDLKLLIPARPLVTGQAAPARPAQPPPAWLAWLDWLIPPAAAGELAVSVPPAGAAERRARPAGREWFVRLKAERPDTGAQDHNNVLGQLLRAKTGYDPDDLVEMPPFAAPYLTLVFPRPDWGAQAGDYASDYRPARGNRPMRWEFELRADPPQGQVILSWQGDPAILRRSRLTDTLTGKTVNAARALKGLEITLNGPVRRFTWRYLGGWARGAANR